MKIPRRTSRRGSAPYKIASPSFAEQQAQVERDAYILQIYTKIPTHKVFFQKTKGYALEDYKLFCITAVILLVHSAQWFY